MISFPLQLTGVALGTCGTGLLIANINQGTFVSEAAITTIILITTLISVLFDAIYLCFNVFLQGPRDWFRLELNCPRQCSAFGAQIMHLSLTAYILVTYLSFPSGIYVSYTLAYFAAILQLMNMTYCCYLLRCTAIREKIGLLSLPEPYFNPVFHSITMSAVGISGNTNFARYVRGLLTGVGLLMLLPSTLSQAYRVLENDEVANDNSIALLQAAPSMVLVGWLLIPTISIYRFESAVAHILFLYSFIFYVSTIYAIMRRRNKIIKDRKHFTISSFTFSFVNTANATNIYFTRNYDNIFDNRPLYWIMRIYSAFVAAIAASIVLYVLTVYISSGLFATSITNDESIQRSKVSPTSVDASAEIEKSTTRHCGELKELTDHDMT